MTSAISFRRWLLAAVIAYLGINALLLLLQRKMLYYPTHQAPAGGLELWYDGTELIGCVRRAASPRAVWLVLHGNAGQAQDRAYVLPHLPPQDDVFILEYPGYGLRAGLPSRRTFDAAAARAYTLLRAQFPGKPVNVFAESVGSGPACSLAAQATPPDQIVLVVPFDRMSSVAAEHLPGTLAPWLLRDRWDNIAALAGYRGPVTIFGAAEDRVIPLKHARRLAAAHPGARFVLIPGGHNDWPSSGLVHP